MNFFQTWDSIVELITNSIDVLPIPEHITDFSNECVKHFDTLPTSHTIEIKVNLLPDGSHITQDNLVYSEISQLSIYVVVCNQLTQRLSYEIGYRIAAFIRQKFTTTIHEFQFELGERNIVLEEIDGNKVSVCFFCQIHHDITE